MDFIGFNPADQVDFSALKISELKSRNTLLTIGLIAAVCVAIYFAYEYYQLKEE